MKVRDKALTPQIAYYATKAVVEAIANPEFGMEAISTDTLEKGTYNGTIWEWADLAGGGVSSGGAYQRNLTANLSLSDGECLVLTGYLNLNTYTLQLSGDAELRIL